jgi:large subunit ribosomal protein L3
MKFILARKQNMTQVFNEDGKVYPSTVLKLEPMTVVSIKDSKDGYKAIKFGYGVRNLKNIKKAQKGEMKDLGNFFGFKEFRTDEVLNVGEKIEPSVLSEGDVVTVSSISKAKGFQGPVKRYGFKGGPRTHGQKHSEREPGSIGGGGRDGGRVAKGKRMAGRMGGVRITTKGLKVIKIDGDLIYIKGAVSGRKGTLVEIKGN